MPRLDLNNDVPYIRVGTDYFKKIVKPDRFGIERIELKRWTKETILFDHDKKFIYKIPNYDDFIIDPNNTEKSSIIHNCYNMYSDFPHTPKQGEWKWTFILLRHIFGTQFKAGMIYLKVLYENPKQALPILVLVSKTRQTGKSTFLDWLNMLFGANMVMIEPDVIGSTFNGEYATSNVIAIDETVLDKQIAVEKIKSLATKKFISVNIKQVAQFKLPFFGKIIMASNNEDKFMRIDDDEIRFWVRKISMPKVENHNILEDMISEIPAFIHYLTTMNAIDYTRSRMVLTADQIQNEYLAAVVKESRSGLFKELTELFSDYFNNSESDECEATPKDIKDRWFSKDNKASISYIRRVIKSEMKMNSADKPKYYAPFNDDNNKRYGAPFMFNSCDYVDNSNKINDKPPF